jgi:hypothetical protein
MSNPEQAAPALATPEQADLILSDVADLAMMQGDGRTYEFTMGLAPAEVQKHFPKPELADSVVIDSVRVAQNFDPAGRPRDKGTLAVVTFTRAEPQSVGVTYETQIDYSVVVDENGKKGMQRHIHERGVDVHKPLPSSLVGRLVMQELPGAQEAHEASLAAEEVLGIPNVTAAEADSIAGFLDSLKPIPAQR